MPKQSESGSGGANVVPLRRNKGKKGDTSEFERKWGRRVRARGFCMVPSLLMKAQLRLGLSPTQFNVILHLLDCWWKVDSKPWPSHQTLAERMNLSSRQVRRILDDLRDAGLVDWEERYRADRGRTTNAYDLSGLVRKLRKLAPEFEKVEQENEENRRAVAQRGGRRRRQGTGTS